jgi:Tfp pilus assembly protein PilO
MTEALSFETLLDVLIALLLAATIAYAFILNRKLTRLRNDRSEMEALISRLINATDDAQKGIEALRTHASEVGERLQKGLEQSRGRADELAFLIERAEGMARRLNAGSVAQKSASPSAAAKPAGTAAGKPSPEEASLLKSLQGIR